MDPRLTPPAPDFLVIGHITKDLQREGFTIGGTVTYSSLTARNLGLRTGIVTSAASDLDGVEILAGIDVLRLPSPVTTTFQNLYPDGMRVQFVRAVAREIRSQDIPLAWRGTKIVHLGPLTQELGSDIVDVFEGSLIGVTPQGWMRRWDEEGRVYPKVWVGAAKILVRAEVLIFSEEDVVRDEKLIAAYARLAKIMVVTRSRQGADLYYRGKRRNFPAFVAREVDPTGAGDVFAAAFLARLYETDDPYEATHFANCVASFCVEAPGIQGLPTREQVEERLAHGQLRGPET
jgi:1D-myo-inositol 3-kinase